MQKVNVDNHNPVKTSNKQARGNSSDQQNQKIDP